MRMTSHGWWMTIPVLVLLGTVISERKSAEKMEQRTKVAGTCCVLIFLYAASTLFSTMSVGQSTVQSPFGNFSAGIKPGPGILFAMLGAGICMVGQTILLQPHLLKPPQVKSPAESKAD
ncbi:MAG: hypothetical protein SH850_26460 [Planctomycetaceae bacterium]|nr:hypothetical protein [Planctomycetaceae bacterium]